MVQSCINISMFSCSTHPGACAPLQLVQIADCVMNRVGFSLPIPPLCPYNFQSPLAGTSPAAPTERDAKAKGLRPEQTHPNPKSKSKHA